MRDRPIRLVQEQAPPYASQWAAITAIPPKLGCTKDTLRRLVREAERQAGHRPGSTRDDDRVKALECEVHELRRPDDLLRKARRFAAAELDCYIR